MQGALWAKHIGLYFVTSVGAVPHAITKISHGNTFSTSAHEGR